MPTERRESSEPDDPSATPRPHLLTIAEAAVYLNVPYTWLRDRVTNRLVPFTRIGRHVRFTPEHLAAIIAAGEVPVRRRPTRRSNGDDIDITSPDSTVIH